MEIIFEAIQGCKPLGAYCQMDSKEQINAQELWSWHAPRLGRCWLPVWDAAGSTAVARPALLIDAERV